MPVLSSSKSQHSLPQVSKRLHVCNMDSPVTGICDGAPELTGAGHLSTGQVFRPVAIQFWRPYPGRQTGTQKAKVSQGLPVKCQLTARWVGQRPTQAPDLVSSSLPDPKSGSRTIWRAHSERLLLSVFLGKRGFADVWPTINCTVLGFLDAGRGHKSL